MVKNERYICICPSNSKMKLWHMWRHIDSDSLNNDKWIYSMLNLLQKTKKKKNKKESENQKKSVKPPLFNTMSSCKSWAKVWAAGNFCINQYHNCQPIDQAIISSSIQSRIKQWLSATEIKPYHLQFIEHGDSNNLITKFC